MLVGAAGISAVKTVKDPSFFGIRYAGAVVLHGQGDFFPTVCQAQFHGGAAGVWSNALLSRIASSCFTRSESASMEGTLSSGRVRLNGCWRCCANGKNASYTSSRGYPVRWGADGPARHPSRRWPAPADPPPAAPYGPSPARHSAKGWRVQSQECGTQRPGCFTTASGLRSSCPARR